MITLRKEDGAADLAGITKMSVGVSWDPSAGASGGLLGMARRKKGVDLDLVAILMQGGDPVRFAGLDSLDPLGNGSVVHTGDEQTGAASGDDETVHVTFANVPTAIDSIVFVAAAFKKGSSFEKANNISFKIYDATGGSSQQVADIWPSLLGSDNANAIARAFRNGPAWQLEVLDRKGKIKQGDMQALLHFALA
ncbi:TerD family protein [Nocardia otitidiscaviarum]|uniref:Stress response protein SCP2 n=1 Tax=Nocardia otitidiscaviarum TaxID=1823 RepID=A0A378YM04_9NOCA|nr:TerD family protein [Nocardia otitidiscaviarum]MBF6133341.1 TerD family protein [Nocardia otitidiscaviarum]MBF6181653.1 TerD family protein [Nocardia otitidiscaviarum]MBF6240586.1 TerD family protein [Nocardia otitidiscaviarum]MBF6486737.1 TerD family protein [Nocardia otitidiscaviarum]MCP9620302.1 TerD family protein [Nocardia otitidiscaviarum]